jgi:1,4-alpha-glucan branching enzyme
MNEHLVDMLRLNGAKHCVYAATRIEELEQENAKLAQESSTFKFAAEAWQQKAVEWSRENARLREERAVLHNCLKHIAAVAMDTDIRLLASQGVDSLSSVVTTDGGTRAQPTD